MEINIHDKRKIHEIQKDFSRIFPNLKLDFFTILDEAKLASASKLLIHPSKAICECRAAHTKGMLTILPHMTILDLKHGFRDTFGLSIQVFRKVGADWLETTSDIWSLEKHNTFVSEMNSENTLEIL
jgi:hypothetical protein